MEAQDNHALNVGSININNAPAAELPEEDYLTAIAAGRAATIHCYTYVDYSARAAARAKAEGKTPQDMYYEAFSLSHAEVGGKDIYGVQSVKLAIHQGDYIEIRSGYLLGGTLPDGPVMFKAPAKDQWGRIATLIYTFPEVTDWRLQIEDTTYKTATYFVYRATVEKFAGTIEVEFPDEEPGVRYKLADL